MEFTGVKLAMAGHLFVSSFQKEHIECGGEQQFVSKLCKRGLRS